MKRFYFIGSAFVLYVLGGETGNLGHLVQFTALRLVLAQDGDEQSMFKVPALHFNTLPKH